MKDLVFNEDQCKKLFEIGFKMPDAKLRLIKVGNEWQCKPLEMMTLDDFDKENMPTYTLQEAWKSLPEFIIKNDDDGTERVYWRNINDIVASYITTEGKLYKYFDRGTLLENVYDLLFWKIQEENKEKEKREKPEGSVEFLLEVNDKNDFSYDFVFSVAQVDDFYKWRNNSDVGISYEKATISDIKSHKGGDSWKNCTPVGSIEFVMAYIDEYCKGSKRPKPINVPECLFKYGKCERKNFSLPGDKDKIIDFIGKGNKFFIKSNTIIKSKYNGLYDNFNDLDKLNDMKECQISKYIPDIKAEFRCFIRNGFIEDIRQYSGDLGINVDLTDIRRIVETYDKSSPSVYTLDVAICGNDDHLEIIEVHDFYSCGLYGFANLSLPYMMKQAFNEIKNRK